jgi:DNA-binding SARP family transcriptional activator
LVEIEVKRMVGLHIALLGGLEITGGEATARASLTRKAKALVAYLVLQGTRGQSREKLAELLWGNSAEEQARANLRQALSSIRKTLNADGAAYLVTDGDQVSLAGQNIDLDVAEFERFVAEATPEALKRAAALYRGDLLDGFSLKEDSFEAWARAERERLRHLACNALVRLIAHCDEVGDTERCVETAARLLALDPLRESAHRILMRAYVAQGRQASALKQFETCRDILRRELGVEPDAEA